MSEDFKNLTASQVSAEVTRLNTVLDRNGHNPAQLTRRLANIQSDVNANRLAGSHTVTDAAQANIAALITALVRSPGDFFKVLGTGDTTDNGLQAAKGGVAPAADDLFYVVDASTVQYVGQV